MTEKSPERAEATAGGEKELSGEQMYQKVMAEMEARGGAYAIWKEEMERATTEALNIKNVILTPELERYLDKVSASMWGAGRLVNLDNAKLESLLDAKRVMVIRARSQSIRAYPPSKAVLYKNVVYFVPTAVQRTTPETEIYVPDDFSRGNAVKLDDVGKIRLFAWNYHEFPPSDGVIGIATQTE